MSIIPRPAGCIIKTKRKKSTTPPVIEVWFQAAQEAEPATDYQCQVCGKWIPIWVDDPATRNIILDILLANHNRVFHPSAHDLEKMTK